MKAHGIDADAHSRTAFAPEFLMQQRQWRKTLAQTQMEGRRRTAAALDHEIESGQGAWFEDLPRTPGQADSKAAAWPVRQRRFSKQAEKANPCRFTSHLHRMQGMPEDFSAFWCGFMLTITQ